MARRAEIAIVYASGLAQGLSVVTFPAASIIFTSPDYHHLTSGEYGSLFVPMVACAILGSALGAGLARRRGLRQVFVAGLSCNVVSMIVLAWSQRFIGRHDVAYGLLLVATTALGAGFGTTLMALNTYAAAFFPGKSATALTALHALLGTGTALAPLLAAIFVRFAVWWLLPLAVGGGLLVLVSLSLGQPPEALSAGRALREAAPRARQGGLPTRLWVYAALVILYGVCETIFGNWATIYLHEDEGISLYWADVALSAFWAMVTAGRAAVATASVWVSARWIYLALPIMILTAFLGIPGIGGVGGNIVVFGFAGLACSAFFPLSISFAEEEFSHMKEVVSGGLTGAYMVGYGLASFGVGRLRAVDGLALSSVYTGSSALAALMAVLAFLLTKPRRFHAYG